MYNDTNHLYLTFLQCVFSILLTDWTMARLIITGGCTMTLVTFIWLFSAMCFLFCSKQLTDWTKARKADHRTADCPKWREELRRYIYGTYMLREKFILLIFVIWYFSFDICLLTNGPMDRWTNGPMDQWTNGPMDILLWLFWHQLHWYCLSNTCKHQLHWWTGWKSEKVAAAAAADI